MACLRVCQQTKTTIGLFNKKGFVSIKFDSSSILLDFVKAWKLAPGAPQVEEGPRPKTFKDSPHYKEGGGQRGLSSEDYQSDEDDYDIHSERLSFGVADLTELQAEMGEDDLQESDWYLV